VKPFHRFVLPALLAFGSSCAAESRDPAPDVHSDVPASPVTTPLPRPGDVDSVPAQAAADWTVDDVTVPSTGGTAVLRAVRTARHEGHDRMVFEFESGVPGYRVSYIDRPVRQCGSGDEVPFEGDAWLSVVFEPSAAHTEEGRPTIEERTRRLDLPNIIELKLICDFEGQVEWVAGVRSPTEYRVLTLVEPERVVIDVQHPDGGNEE
jgi:hypothetical protein